MHVHELCIQRSISNVHHLIRACESGKMFFTILCRNDIGIYFSSLYAVFSLAIQTRSGIKHFNSILSSLKSMKCLKLTLCKVLTYKISINLQFQPLQKSQKVPMHHGKFSKFSSFTTLFEAKISASNIFWEEHLCLAGIGVAPFQHYSMLLTTILEFDILMLWVAGPG